MFIDTHVHLNNAKLYKKINQVMSEAQTNHVDRFIVVGYDLKTSMLALEIAGQYANCYASIGFHPTEIKNYGVLEERFLNEHAGNPKVVAIGECGYDFHWKETTKEEQEKAFISQIAIAKRYQLPLIIHSRDAMQLTYDTLKQEAAHLIGGIMHSYSGSKEMAQAFVKMNFLLGISGPVTYKNGVSMKETVAAIDLKYLVSETDSPYLTPHPHRGMENGPKYLPLIVETIADIKQMTVEAVAEQINQNVKRLLGV